MSDPIRIMIAEDHALFAQGLRRVLDTETQMHVVAEVSDGETAVAQALALRPNVVIMDVSMPGGNGLLATQRIKAAAPQIAVIILTAFDDEEQLLFAIRAGASAYFAKSVPPETLIQTIREVHRGLYVIEDRVMKESEMLAWMLKRVDELAVFGQGPDTTLMPLSPREMDVLEYIVRGATNKEIAAGLRISPQTVKNHMSNIMRKLSVGDRTEAAIVALRRGWIRLQDTAEPVPGEPSRP